MKSCPSRFGATATLLPRPICATYMRRSTKGKRVAMLSWTAQYTHLHLRVLSVKGVLRSPSCCPKGVASRESERARFRESSAKFDHLRTAKPELGSTHLGLVPHTDSDEVLHSIGSIRFGGIHRIDFGLGSGFGQNWERFDQMLGRSELDQSGARVDQMRALFESTLDSVRRYFGLGPTKSGPA